MRTPTHLKARCRTSALRPAVRKPRASALSSRRHHHMTSAQRKLLLAFACARLRRGRHVELRALPTVDRRVVRECLRRKHVDQLHASLSEPIRQPLGRAGCARRRDVLCDGARPGRVGWPAERQVAREIPGYIFALSTLALALVLYLGWASYFVLKTFCILCAITYIAVIAIFLISGGATTFPMKTLPDRARRDVRTLVSSPLALLIALLFVAGATMAVAVFPRDAAASGSTVAGQAPAPLPPSPTTTARRSPSGGRSSPRARCRSQPMGRRC